MPKTRDFLTLLCLFLFLSGGAALAQEAEVLELGLADCLKLSSANHGKIEGMKHSIEAAKWRHNEAQARFWPVLEYKNRMAPVPTDADNPVSTFFNGDVTFFNSLHVGVAVPLYASGQLTLAQKLARHGVEAEEAKKDNEESKLHHEVRQLYYGILFGREIEFLLEDAVRKISKRLEEEEETQELSPYKLAKLKIFKVDLEKRIQEAKTGGTIAEEALRVQLGLGPDRMFRVRREDLHAAVSTLPALETFSEPAKSVRGDSRLLNIGVAAKKLEGRLERRKLMPQIGAGAFMDFGRTTGEIRNVGATDDFNNPFNFTRAGLGLEIRGNIDFHGGRSRIKRLDSEYYKSLVESSLAREGIQLEVEQSWIEAKEALANVARAEQKRKLARQMLFFSKSNREIGVGEEEEYADALQLVLLSRGEYYKALFDFNVAYSKLQWKAGHIGL